MEKVEVQEKPIGLVIILNNIEHFQEDVEKLSSLFAARNYRVKVLNNLDQLENTEKYKDLILFFFGYGYGSKVLLDRNQETIMSYNDLYCFLHSKKFGFSQIVLLSEVYYKPKKLKVIRRPFRAELENVSHLQIGINEMQPISILRKCFEMHSYDNKYNLRNFYTIVNKEMEQFSQSRCILTYKNACTDAYF